MGGPIRATLDALIKSTHSMYQMLLDNNPSDESHRLSDPEVHCLAGNCTARSDWRGFERSPLTSLL